MTNRCCNGLVYVMIMWLLLIVVLSASPAQCSRQLLEAARASTTIDEGKFKVKFCILRSCLVGGDYVDCYCCMNGKPPICFTTEDYCRASCPNCNPKCPPVVAIGPTKRQLNSSLQN